MFVKIINLSNKKGYIKENTHINYEPEGERYNCWRFTNHINNNFHFYNISKIH